MEKNKIYEKINTFLSSDRFINSLSENFFDSFNKPFGREFGLAKETKQGHGKDIKKNRSDSNSSIKRL